MSHGGTAFLTPKTILCHLQVAEQGTAEFQQSGRLAALGILCLQEGSWADHSLFQILILIKSIV